MRWLFAYGSEVDRDYARHVLDRMNNGDVQAMAPSVWPLEVANVIVRAEARGNLHEAQSTEFLCLLERLGVIIDEDTAQNALSATLSLARRYQLSAYHASYLELALRQTAPLATLDTTLREAAEQAGIGCL